MKYRLNYFVGIAIVLAFICFGHSAQSQNVIGGGFGKGINVVTADSTFSMKFNLRFQTLYQGNYYLDNNTYVDNMLIRRFRLKFDGHAGLPNVRYKIELGASNRDIGGATPETSNAARLILDAVLKWRFAKNFDLWVGQTKLPGNRQRMVSSQKLQFVDRSALNSRFNLDRDIGIQLHHKYKIGGVIFKEIASIAKGDGRNITVNNKKGYDLTGRFEILPMGDFSKKGDYFESDLERESKPKLSLAVSYDYNANASRERGQNGSWLDETRTLATVYVDAMYKYKGFSVLAEYVNRQVPGTDSPIENFDVNGNVNKAFYTGKAINAQAAYLLKNNIEIGLRYTDIVPEQVTERTPYSQYTIGLSKYVIGHSLKVQSDFTYNDGRLGGKDFYMFRAQVEMAF